MKFQDALNAVENFSIEMLADPNSGLAAIAIGNKNGGSIEGARDFCVTAYVPRKMTQAELANRNVLSFTQLFTNVTGSAPQNETDINVVESGSMFVPSVGLSAPAHQGGKFGGAIPSLDTQKWFSALRLGIGISNPNDGYPNNLSVGTLGFFVRDSNNNEYLVSNNHVIGRSNDAKVGEAVVQPGTLDLTGVELSLMRSQTLLESTLKIAEVTAVVQLKYIHTTPAGLVIPNNEVDAAMAILTDSGRTRDDLNRVSYGGRILRVAAPYTINPAGSIVGSAKVYKVGRTTGYTEGTVVGIAGTTRIDYETSVGTQTARFHRQIVIQATQDNTGFFSDAGDSGSAVLNENHEIVGLLFAGSSRQTLVNPIDEVLAQLGSTSGISGLQVIV